MLQKVSKLDKVFFTLIFIETTVCGCKILEQLSKDEIKQSL